MTRLRLSISLSQEHVDALVALAEAEQTKTGECPSNGRIIRRAILALYRRELKLPKETC